MVSDKEKRVDDSSICSFVLFLWVGGCCEEMIGVRTEKRDTYYFKGRQSQEVLDLTERHLY